MSSCLLLLLVFANGCYCTPFKWATSKNVDRHVIDREILFGDDAKTYAMSIGGFETIRRPVTQSRLDADNTVIGEVSTIDDHKPQYGPYSKIEGINEPMTKLDDGITKAFFSRDDAKRHAALYGKMEGINTPMTQLRGNVINRPFLTGSDAKRHAALYGKMEGINTPMTQLRGDVINRPFLTGSDAKRHAALYGKMEGINTHMTQLRGDIINKPFFTGDEGNTHLRLYGKMEGINVPKIQEEARGFISAETPLKKSQGISKKLQSIFTSSGSIRLYHESQNLYLILSELLLIAVFLTKL